LVQPGDHPQRLGFLLVFGAQQPQGLLPLLVCRLGILHCCGHFSQMPEGHVSRQRNQHLSPAIEYKCQSGHRE
ncbi:MAG: hypothetical protein Q8M07_06930, partial [Prosthecobacter sp.]|nr:hypothetical protein [Prosthecobacter sp.]